MMDVLEETFNDVSDGSAAWWPFLFLRPSRHERMTSLRVLVLAALYGIFAGLLLVVVRACGRELPAHPASFPIGATIALFAMHRFTFAYFWNRRADRLSHARARFAKWRALSELSDDGQEEDG